MNLRDKAISGIGWSFTKNISQQLLSFVIGIILARLLTPSEFGLIGLTTVFFSFSQIFLNSGFGQALIQKNKVTEEDLNTVFLFNIVIAMFLYILLYIFSENISIFFKQPELKNIIKILGLNLIIFAFSLIHNVIFRIEINFKVQMKIGLISTIIGGLVGVSLAYLNYGVWSLVFKILSTSFIMMMLNWYFSEWRPNFKFSMRAFEELFGFGSKILFTGVIDSIYRNLNYILIGKFYSASQLGFYTRAENFGKIFSATFFTTLDSVSFPVFSKVKNDSARLRIGYSKMIKITMLITSFFLFNMAAMAKPFILILIGDKWTQSIIYLQLFSIALIFYPINNFNLNLLKVVGRSDLLLKLSIIRKVIVLPITLITLYYGIIWLLIGMIFSGFILFYFNSYYSKYFINYSGKEQIKDILPGFLISLSVGLVTFSITLLDLNIYLTFMMQIITFIVLGIVLFELIKLEEYKELKKIGYEFFNKIKRN